MALPAINTVFLMCTLIDLVIDGLIFFFCRYEKEGRLTVTDHKTNFSRTYEGTSDIIPAFLSTDFKPSDYLYVGGLPDGVMVSECKAVL